MYIVFSAIYAAIIPPNHRIERPKCDARRVDGSFGNATTTLFKLKKLVSPFMDLNNGTIEGRCTSNAALYRFVSACGTEEPDLRNSSIRWS
jgi:hypothetical protein